MTSTLRRIVRCAVAAVLMTVVVGPAHAAPTADPSGTWLTEDGRARIRVERCGASLEQICGYIVWAIDAIDAKGAPVRDRYNPDTALRSRLVLGHQLILGLKPSWDGRYVGEIYNADNGKVYSISLWREGVDKLKVRGCMLSLLCATQVWTQTNDVLPGQLVGMTGDPGGPKPDKDWARSIHPKSPASVKVAR